MQIRVESEKGVASVFGGLSDLPGDRVIRWDMEQTGRPVSGQLKPSHDAMTIFRSPHIQKSRLCFNIEIYCLTFSV